MTSHELAAPQEGWVNPSPLDALRSFCYKTYVITELEARKLKHDPTELLTRAVQPALWLLIFGGVFSQLRAVSTGNVPYRDFMAPGILAQSVLFVAIFFGIAIIWERDLGTIHKLFVSPTPRAALVLGKAISAGIRSLSQIAIVYALSVLTGVHMNWNPLALVGVGATVLLGAACFSTLSLIIASIVKTRERFMGVGQLMTMPVFFASNAIYPIAAMPGWLQAVATLNPLSYEVDLLRSFMIVGGSSVFGVGRDFVLLIVVDVLLIIVGARVYPRVAA